MSYIDKYFYTEKIVLLFLFCNITANKTMVNKF